MANVQIIEAVEVTPELVAAFERLIPQLSSSNPETPTMPYLAVHVLPFELLSLFPSWSLASTPSSQGNTSGNSIVRPTQTVPSFATGCLKLVHIEKPGLSLEKLGVMSTLETDQRTIAVDRHRIDVRYEARRQSDLRH